MAFQGSSRFTIKGGSFTNIAGDQHNHIQGDLVQVINREKNRSIWDEYIWVPTGKIYIKKTICDTDVKRENKKNQSWWNVDARRIINLASIQGEDKDSEFLYISYNGQDAHKAFHKDFEQFSCVRDVKVAQLFGYNDGQFALPALIFYNAPVPVAWIWEYNQFSSLLGAYFQYLFGVIQISKQAIDLRELWIYPRTGTLCIGPYVQYSSTNLKYSASGFRTNLIPIDAHPFLSLHTYSDSSTLFSYLTQRLSAQNIVQGITQFIRSTLECVANEQIAFMLSSLPATIYSRTQHKVIAKWPGNIEEWYYKPVSFGSLPDGMHARCPNINHGSIRIMVMPSHIQQLQSWKFSFYYSLHPMKEWFKFAVSWLLQAHSVLSQCKYQENEWEGSSSMYGFMLNLQCTDSCLPWRKSNISTKKPVYLFIQPIPHPLDHKSVWDAWAQGRKYFWSSDYSGCEEMSEDTRLSLGLPSFTSRIEISQDWWDCTVYNSIKQLHILNGFNPLKTDFAQSLGFSILKVIGNGAQSENAKILKL
uniref:Uncharacterized protein n=1 Tax=Moniliophthora roreri TaxID=221103 RepID=A0A0W0FPN6_MONRR